MIRVALVSVNHDWRDPAYPIGLVILATYIKNRMPGIHVAILDPNFENIEDRAAGFDIVGVTAMTSDYTRATRYAETIKKRFDVPTVVGGVHISTLPTSLAKCFDVGVVGEGEETFLELLEIFNQHGSLSGDKIASVKGIVYHGQDGLIQTERRKQISLDDTLLPDWSLINRAYFDRRPTVAWADSVREMHILTARGCPYDCIFCSTTQMWERNIRFHSAEYVAATIEQLAKSYGVTHIQVYDDLFAVNLNRLKEIARLLDERDLAGRVKIFCSVRANLVNDALCEALAALNVKMVFFGFESGNNRVLRLLKGGNVSVEQNRIAIKTCVKHGLAVHGSVIFGSPGESLEEMHDTLRFIDYAYREGAWRILGFVMTPYPKTKVWEIAKERGRVSEDMDWEILTQIDERNPLLLDDSIPQEEFGRIMAGFHRKERKFQARKVMLFIRNSPLGLLRYIWERVGG
ncbi:MAG TPA: radical SAM protein [Verrucomicrobiae bacterium]|nr:radical SAM protein [Verrucomicrobiae bacterium]